MSYRILIVDDSRVMREMIQRTVKLSGIEVQSIEQAGDGQQALERMRSQPFDLVLLDINMPVLDGEQVLAQVRGDPNLSHIPVIIASTESSDTRIRRLRLMGAEFIHKPFRPEDLATLVVKISASKG